MGQQTNRVEKGWDRVQTEQQFLSLSLSTYSKVFKKKKKNLTASLLITQLVFFFILRLLNCVTALLNNKMFRFLIGNVAET